MITGAAGFIGSALCSRLAHDNKVIGVDVTDPPDGVLNIAWEQVDLSDLDSAAALCENYSPDVVIHCAGIAHQKIGAVDSATYMRVNSEVTEKLAEAAAKFNRDVIFIFLSSICVYGEDPHPRGMRSAVTSEFHGAGISHYDNGVGEDGECWPSSDYAVSKLDAERRLRALYDEGKLKNLIILRLAPVYDRDWSLNLDRRVFAPGKVAYLRVGSGTQRMSALARPILVDFVEFLIKSKLATDSHRHTGRKKDVKRSLTQRRKDAKIKDNSKVTQKYNSQIFNVCDAEAYEFNEIITALGQSSVHPNRPVIPVPLSLIWLLTRIAGFLLPKKKQWLHSAYQKLTQDLVFDNTKMLSTGFTPKHILESIFAS